MLVNMTSNELKVLQYLESLYRDLDIPNLDFEQFREEMIKKILIMPPKAFNLLVLLADLDKEEG